MGGNIDEAGNVRSQPSPRTYKHSTFLPEPAFRLIKQPPSRLRNMLNSRNQMTPVAEFNTFADSIAAARVYALTSPNPQTTMPPVPPAPPGQAEGKKPPPFRSPYPDKLSKQLKVTLFPLDITERHILTRGEFRKTIEPLLKIRSPLAEWTAAFMNATFDKVESLHPDVKGDAVGLQLHDPLCIWYCMTDQDFKWELIEDEDIRVETSGQWTRGMCVVDRRDRRRAEDDDGRDVPGDTGDWLRGGSGNRLRRCIESPGRDLFGTFMLKRIFAL